VNDIDIDNGWIIRMDAKPEKKQVIVR